ncbi:MAG TPA: CvpA family protein [Chitinophagaceae bacterium]|nr:CvpA family protein [Chitinophagaceae bacterium]
MVIDIIVVILLVVAVIKGYRRGLIIGLFSFVAIIIGLAAAIKLSTLVAGYLGSSVKISDRWLPVISFAVVFLLVVLLIRLGARALEKTAEMITLGWLNKLGGILLYAGIYITVFSILLFYAEQLQLVKKETIANSGTYSLVQPLGPWAINGIGKVVPFFRDMFTELEAFFENLSGNIPPAGK